MNKRNLAGRVALVTGVTRRAGIGAAIARELARAGAKVFVTGFRQYDQQQAWGIEPGEPESLLRELGSIADDVAGAELGGSVHLASEQRRQKARLDLVD